MNQLPTNNTRKLFYYFFLIRNRLLLYVGAVANAYNFGKKHEALAFLTAGTVCMDTVKTEKDKSVTTLPSNVY